MSSRLAAVSLFVCLATPFVFSTSDSAQTNEWTVCAPEGGVCAFTGTKEVRYGANGSFFYKTLTDGTACTNSVFGDPVVGTAKQCAVGTTDASDWTFCAPEGGICVFTGTQEVRYGANGAYFYKSLTDGTACTNGVFGDPAVGTPKQCATRASSYVASSTATTDWALCASEGGVCAFAGTKDVRYGANGSYFYTTATDGTDCTNSVFGDPAVGTPKQCDVAGAGPRSTITCPGGSVDIWPSSSIQDVVSFHPSGITYCLRAGVHPLTSAITPKSGDTFVGEYGAILDGSDWSTSDSTQAAFRAHNQDIDDVTIRNLVIRKMPQKGIHAFTDFSDRWRIEYNEIAFNHTGLVFPNSSIIRNNYIHHNVGKTGSFSSADRGGGYVGYYVTDTTLDSNEIAYNGTEQKVMDSVRVTFRNNFVHHNVYDGIWYDGGNPGALVEGNRVEDNGRIGVFYEAGKGSIIRNNTLRRSGEAGVVISTSQNAQIYSNTLEHNFRGIIYFINCGVTAEGRDLDLKNVSAQDNTISVSTQGGALASGLSYTVDCTSTQLALYLDGSKNLTFSRNTYYVPGLTSWFDLYWLWGDQRKSWNEWQSVGHDLDGLVFTP